MARLAATPIQLERLLQILIPHGFTPARVRLAPDGSITLEADAAEPTVAHDPLTQWELRRGQQFN